MRHKGRSNMFDRNTDKEAHMLSSLKVCQLSSCMTVWEVRGEIGVPQLLTSPPPLPLTCHLSSPVATHKQVTAVEKRSRRAKLQLHLAEEEISSVVQGILRTCANHSLIELALCIVCTKDVVIVLVQGCMMMIAMDSDENSFC